MLESFIKLKLDLTPVFVYLLYNHSENGELHNDLSEEGGAWEVGGGGFQSASEFSWLGLHAMTLRSL